jgi:hypothetical protein
MPYASVINVASYKPLIIMAYCLKLGSKLKLESSDNTDEDATCVDEKETIS